MTRRSLAVAVIMGLLACYTATASADSMNGRQGTMGAYYDHQLFTINFKLMPKNLPHNQSINTIYMSDAGLPGHQMFIAVLDAIQGDGFNPLWQEVQITFNPGFRPHQLFSDTEVLRLAREGQITLTPTGELYRCSVIGPK